MKGIRGAVIVAFLAVAAYANTLSNGFAYDDNAVIVQNGTISTGDWRGAISSRYHPQAVEGGGLYRPLTSAVFALEWTWFDGKPTGFHALNILLHAAVSVMVFFLLSTMIQPTAAAIGSGLFAVHPVHTEAVANVVGMGELLSALFLILACLLYLQGRDWIGIKRGIRLVGIASLYLLSLGGKEIGVALPVVLLLLDRFQIRKVKKELAVYLLLAVVLAAYLAQRWMVLGTLSGEVPSPTLSTLDTGQRVLTAIGLWFQYARLLLFPLDLSADYAPGVLMPSESLDLNVLLGLGVVAGLILVSIRAIRSRRPLFLVAMGVAWFGVTILPVSNLLFPAGVLLAERTLYLPSIGLSMAAGGAVTALLEVQARNRRWILGVTSILLVVLLARTVQRNPVWDSTISVLESLNRDHPESHLVFLNRGAGLEQAGAAREAGEAYEMALRLTPARYGTLTAVSGFLGGIGEWDRAEELARRAMEIVPARDDAYRLLAAHLLRQGKGREAHSVALEGMVRGQFHSDLWAAVSESYVLKGDLEAAIRARTAAAAIATDPQAHSERLEELRSAQETKTTSQGGER